jgi:hypothetical protein
MKKYRVTHPIPGYQAGDPIKPKDEGFNKFLKLGLIAEIARSQSATKKKRAEVSHDSGQNNLK